MYTERVGMTCIVGLIDNGVSYIGGERGASTDSTIISIAEPKVWKTGEYLFGYYGTFMGERLKYNFEPPEIGDNDVVTFMNSVFLRALHECYDDWWMQRHQDDELMIIVRNKIFIHNAEDMNITHYDVEYMAEGSGMGFALGSLHTSSLMTESWTPEDRVQAALEAAVTFSPSCLAPIDIISSEE